MISARSAALQGLSPALGALRIGLQGLWPEDSAGAHGGVRSFLPQRTRRPDRREDDDSALHAIVALITSGILDT